MKIGIGSLVKPDDKAYTFVRNYEIKNPGTWTVKKKKDRVEFTHVLKDAAGYGYEYQKTVRLVKGKPELVLEHSLKNTGTKPIETSTYNHNFFVIDGEPTGPNISTTFPYEVSAEGKGFGTIAEAKNKAIIYNRTLAKGENVFTTGVQGIAATPTELRLYHPKFEKWRRSTHQRRPAAGKTGVLVQPQYLLSGTVYQTISQAGRNHPLEHHLCV